MANNIAVTAGTGTTIGTIESSSTHHQKVVVGDTKIAGNTTYVKKYYTNSGAVTDGIIWSPAAGTRWYLTSLIINTSAAATVTIEDDLAAGDNAIYKAELAANANVVMNFEIPLFSGEDAADLMVTTSAGNIYITAVGYEI